MTESEGCGPTPSVGQSVKLWAAKPRGGDLLFEPLRGV